MQPVDEDISREAGDAFCLTQEDADRLLSGAPWRRFVVIGDSLAEGLGDPSPGYRTLPWPDRVAEALRRRQPDLEFTNLGLRNLRAAEIREQQLGPALEFRPDLVAFVAGGNDLFVAEFDADAVERELDGIVGPLRAAGADVVFFALQNIALAIPQLASMQPRMEQLNERVRAVSARHGALLVDMWAHPVCGDTDIYSSDLVHSTMRGHAVLAAEVIRRLGEHLSTVRHG